MFVPCFVVHCFVSYLFFNHLYGEDRTGEFALFVFLVSCGCYFSAALPHGPWVALKCVIVVFPVHTHLIFQ